MLDRDKGWKSLPWVQDIIALDLLNGNMRPIPAGSIPDMGAHENSLSQPDTPPLNLFGLSIGNNWIYNGTIQGTLYNLERNITHVDETTFPVATFISEI